LDPVQDGLTPLHWAAIDGRNKAVEILRSFVEKLVKAGANVNATNKVIPCVRLHCTTTAKCESAASANTLLVFLLFFWLQDGYTPLYQAVRVGHGEIAETLVHEGADVNATSEV